MGFQLEIYTLSRIGLFWLQFSIQINTMSRIGYFLVAVFNTNKYHGIWRGYFSVGVSIRYIPCLEQDIFGSVNRSLRFHPHTSAGKVLAPFFSDGPCIGFFSTLHYIISHQMALLWSTYIKTLPKAQRTRGLSLSYQSNFLR